MSDSEEFTQALADIRVVLDALVVAVNSVGEMQSQMTNNVNNALESFGKSPMAGMMGRMMNRG